MTEPSPSTTSPEPEPKPAAEPAPAAEPEPAAEPAPAAGADSEPTEEQPDDEASHEKDLPSPWELVKAALSIVRSPLTTTPRLAVELSATAAAMLGAGGCALMAVSFPLTREPRADVLDGVVRYGFDVLITLAGLAVFAAAIQLFRRFAFEQEGARFGQSIFLVGSFALIVGVAGLGAGLLQLAHLGFLAPVLLGAAKVVGLVTVYSALPAVDGTQERGVLLALAAAAGVANLVFALEQGMGLLF